LGGRDRQISEFKASLVYKVSSRIARAIQRNPVSGGGGEPKYLSVNKGTGKGGGHTEGALPREVQCLPYTTANSRETETGRSL
jgi:hypothetical protein